MCHIKASEMSASITTYVVCDTMKKRSHALFKYSAWKYSASDIDAADVRLLSFLRHTLMAYRVLQKSTESSNGEE